MPASSQSILLVASEARVPDDACRAASPGAEWTRCRSLDEARAYLGAAAFDTVVVDSVLASGDDLQLGTTVRVVNGDDPSALQRALGNGVDEAAMLRELLQELSRAVHDANNPLTVITGNAQYALEMARALDVDESLLRSVSDIEEAGRHLEAAMGELSAIRRRLQAALGTGESLR